MKQLTYAELASEVRRRAPDFYPLFPAKRLKNADPGSAFQIGVTVTPFQEKFIRAFGGGNASAGLRRMIFLLQEVVAEHERGLPRDDAPQPTGNEFG